MWNTFIQSFPSLGGMMTQMRNTLTSSICICQDEDGVEKHILKKALICLNTGSF